MAATSLLALTPASFRGTPWKNGGGVTLDIADAYRPGARPGGWDGMIWRFGRTGIVTPGPFSDLTGFERMQIVVAGRGLALETPDGEIDLREPFAPVRYDGGTPIASRLEDGPVEVVNLIADRRLCAIDLVVLASGGTAALPHGTHLLYAPGEALSGACDGRPFTLEPGHALRIETDGEASLALVSGRGVLASIAPR